MASTFSFLRRKAKSSMDEDLQLSLDEPNFRKEFLKGESPYLCGLSRPSAMVRVATATHLKANAPRVVFSARTACVEWAVLLRALLPRGATSCEAVILDVFQRPHAVAMGGTWGLGGVECM